MIGGVGNDDRRGGGSKSLIMGSNLDFQNN